MKEDMTYNEIIMVKEYISGFVTRLKDISFKFEYIMEKSDESFFINIAKHIIFHKYLYRPLIFRDLSYFLEVLVSDSYYLVLSIIKREKRYMYVNIRSILETSTRMLTRVTVENNHVTRDTFNKLKNLKYPISEDEYSLIRSEYRIACNFIHGGKLLQDDLSFVLDECLQNNEISIKDKNALYQRICSILRIFDNMIIGEYNEMINECFHRRKSLLEAVQNLLIRTEMKAKIVNSTV